MLARLGRSKGASQEKKKKKKRKEVMYVNPRVRDCELFTNPLAVGQSLSRTRGARLLAFL